MAYEKFELEKKQLCEARSITMANQTMIEIKNKIKRNVLVRALVAPIMSAKHRGEYNAYVKSEEARYFRELKDIQKGKRCFIVCNGPSLKPEDLELIKNEYSFGFNRIYYMFDRTSWRPSCYMSVDKDVILMNKREIKEIDVSVKFLDLYAKKHVNRMDNMHYLCMRDGFIVRPYSDKKIHFSNDISLGYCDGGTVTYVAIQLAAYMGFKEIFLLGADHNYSTYRRANGKTYKNKNVETYFNGLKSTGITAIDLDRTTKAYMVAKKQCEQDNIRIYNATRGGKLEVFERVKLDDIL